MIDVLLWNSIRDFIVQHITGGERSDGELFGGFLGQGGWYTNELGFLGLGENTGQGVAHKFCSIGDWLATTLTIISLIFILVACVMFVVKMVKLVGNLVK